MANAQEIQDAERFKKLLERSDGLKKSIFLNGGPVEIARALGGNVSEMEVSRIMGDRNAYYLTQREVVAKVENKKTEKDKLDQSTARTSRSLAGGAAGIIASPFSAISRFINNPDRYSAEQLEKKANEYAKKKTKASGNKVLLSGNVYSNTYTKAQQEYYDLYAKTHRKAADRIAAKSPNGYLLNAIAKDNAAKENKIVGIISKIPFVSKSGIPITAPTPAPALKPRIANFLKRIPTSSRITKPVVPGGVSVPIRSRIPSRNRIRSMLPGKGLSSPAGKLPNPLSLLRRFGPTSAIIGGIIGIMFLTMIICLLLGIGVGTVAGGSASDQSGLPVSPISIEDVKQCVIIEQNGSAETLTDEQKNFIYEAFALPMGSKTYNKLLCSAGPIHLYFYEGSGDSVSGGANYGGSGNMKYWGFFEFLGDPSKATQRKKDMLAHILVHESGHIIDIRNGELGYSRTSLASQESSCYNNHNKTTNVTVGQVFISTYAYRDNGKYSDGHQDTVYQYDPVQNEYVLTPADHGTVNAESFAESIANNVFCKPGENCDYNHIFSSTPIVYNGKCPATYNWIRQNIFGGDDFFAPTTTNTNMCNGFYTAADARNSSVLTSPNSNCPAPACPENIYQHKGENFGDPQCELTNNTEAAREDIVNSYLEQIDPNNVTAWDTLITCESHFHPLSFAPNSHSTFGAYGMAQMNPKINPYTGKDRGSTNDIGDVSWKEQLQNAVNRSVNIGGFGYWGCGGGLTRQ